MTSYTISNSTTGTTINGSIDNNTSAYSTTCNANYLYTSCDWSVFKPYPTETCYTVSVPFYGETKEGYSITCLAPGFSKETISVTYVTEDCLLKIFGEAKIENIKCKADLSFKIPKKFDLDCIECQLKNGILEIFIPFKKGLKPKEAKIA